jgi:diguanylate cyclase (GGDEF)-like protein
VSRWGGDEFLAVQPGVDSDIAAGVAARIVKALEDAPILLPSGEMLPVTVSIGVTTAMADGFTEAIEEADTALRAAKQAGRNGVQLARPTNG